MANQPTHDAITQAAADHEEMFAAHREGFAARSWYDVDPRLALLLAPIGTDPDATMELTVVVDGTVISGSVVSEQAWARRQHDQVRPGSPAMADALESLQSTADEQRVKAAETDANRRLKAQDRYIHFLEPLVISGGAQIRLQATRVDLRGVSAWSIGRVPSE
ncbi:hypothetical protein QFZ70_000373 [Arthrobacter sp. V1I9]|uniref:hypothetical protein n=1 Tax=Arthrobacter sp. V1I9 TaxID=3042275 RepID=UPI00278DFAEE|nr:hypothetical protein [Arthrobacter sp. V1I9]MDQ0867900.1 hypothetical protein [Arthrobacter sp. V1I9]